MKCQECLDFLMAYLDGELPEDERQLFQAHLELCPPCVVYLDTYQEAVRLGRAACCGPDPEEPPPPDVPEELVQAILAVRRRQPPV